MRHYSQALNAELFRYRKRKRLSIDGTVAGQSGSHYLRGLHYVTPRSAGSRTNHSVHDHSVYDASALYAFPEQDYEQPASWFEQEFASTPQLRFEPPAFDPIQPLTPIPKYDDGLITPELQDHVAAAFRRAAAEQILHMSEPEGSMADILDATNTQVAAEGVLADSPLSNETDSRPEFSEVANAIGQLENALPADHPYLVSLREAAHEWIENSNAWLATQPFDVDCEPSKLGIGNPYELASADPIDQEPGFEYTRPMDDAISHQAMEHFTDAQPMPELIDQEHDPMQQAHDEYYAQGLEAIVQQAMPEQDLWERQQQMYDEERQMLMKPYMGPMGPMPMPPGLG